jgi:hypothetical protein
MRALVWTVVVLTVLVGGAVVVDGVARDRTEERVAAELTGIPGIEGSPEVTIAGFPFLTQLADGELGTVVVTAPAATVEGLRMEDVDARFTGVTTSAPYTAASADLTAMVRPDDVEAVLAVDVDLGIRDGELIASTSVLGLPLDVVLVPRAAGRDVEVDVTAFLLGGVRVESEDLPAGVADELAGIRFAVNGLPDGMELTGVEVDEDGLRLTAVGRGLTLAEG